MTEGILQHVDQPTWTSPELWWTQNGLGFNLLQAGTLS